MADVEIDVLIERIQLRLEALKLSERKASLLATGRPDAIRYIRTRRSMPSMARLMKLATVLETDPAYLIGNSEDPKLEPSVAAALNSMSERALDQLAQFAEREDDGQSVLPVFETGSLGHELFPTSGRDLKSVNIYSFGDAIDAIVERPLFMRDRPTVAIRMPDNTMQPVYEPGSLLIMRRGQKINYRDDLMLGLIPADGAGDRHHIFGRLVSRRDDTIELRQFGTNSSFLVPIDRVRALYRILRLSDFLAAPDDRGINAAEVDAA